MNEKNSIIPNQLMQFIDKLESLGKEIRDKVVPGNQKEGRTIQSASSAAYAYKIAEDYRKLAEKNIRGGETGPVLGLIVAAYIAYAFGGSNCDHYSAMSAYLISNAAAHWGVKIKKIERYANEKQKHSFLEIEVELDSGEVFIVNFDPWATNKINRYSGLRKDFMFYNESFHVKDISPAMISGTDSFNTLEDAKKNLMTYGNLLLAECFSFKNGEIDINQIKVNQYSDAEFNQLPYYDIQERFLNVKYISENDPQCPISIQSYANPKNLYSEYQFCLKNADNKNLPLEKNKIYIELLGNMIQISMIDPDKNEPEYYNISLDLLNNKKQFQSPLSLQHLEAHAKTMVLKLSTKKQQDKIFNDIMAKLPDSIEHWRQFATMYKNIRNDHKNILFEKIYNSNKCQDLFVNTGLLTTYKHLSPKHQQLLYTKLKNKNNFDYIYQTPQDYANIFATLKSPDLINEFLITTAPTIKTKTIEFITNIFKDSNQEIRSILFNLHKDQLRGAIQDIYHLLNDNEKNELLSQLENNPKLYIKNIYLLPMIYNTLNDNHKEILFTELEKNPTLYIIDSIAFTGIYNTLNDNHKERLFATLENNPKIYINNYYDFRDYYKALKALDEDLQERLFAKLENNPEEYITNIDVLEDCLKFLTYAHQERILSNQSKSEQFQACKNKYKDMLPKNNDDNKNYNI